MQCQNGKNLIKTTFTKCMNLWVESRFIRLRQRQFQIKKENTLFYVPVLCSSIAFVSKLKIFSENHLGSTAKSSF